MTRTRLARTLAIFALGVALLVLVGLPVPSSVRAPRTLASWLVQAPPMADPTADGILPAGELSLISRFRNAPSLGAEALELAVARFGTPDIDAGTVARTAVALRRAEFSPDRPSADPLGRELPLRAIEGIGPRGLQILARSAENAARLPSDLQFALADLVCAVNIANRALLSERSALLELRADERLTADATPWEQGAGEAPAGSTSPSGSVALETRLLEGSLCDQALILVSDALDRLRVAWARSNAEGRGFLETLHPIDPADDLPADLCILTEIDAGWLMVSGVGGSVLPLEGVAIAVDLGGDDHWYDGLAPAACGTALGRVQVVVDLSGDDRYSAPAGTLGVAQAGSVSLVFDAEGDDRYQSDVAAFGVARGGSSLHIDAEGDDTYDATGGALGFGLFGLGVLFDGGGNDRYHCDRVGLGAGLAGGVGVLVDRWGNDIYQAGVDSGSQMSWVLGAGGCSREAGPGGVGVLIDGGGNDLYRAGAGALGFADGRSVGALFDEGGDDRYASRGDSQGSARGGGVGILHDAAGADEYVARSRALGYGAAALGVFLDQGGADRILWLPPGRGASSDRGFSLFVDR